MSRRFPELDRIRVTVDDDVRERHLAAIGDAVRSARAPRLRRFRLLAVAVAVVVALPVMALASENAVPGDLLYPIKRVLEPLISVVDRDVEADHRVREAEVLLERDAEPSVIRDHVDRARVVLTDEHKQHRTRLDVVVGELEDRPGVHDGESAVPLSDRSAGDAPEQDRTHQSHRTEDESPDRPTDSTDPPPATTTTKAHDLATEPTERSRDG